jgi:hypothetical protein
VRQLAVFAERLAVIAGHHDKRRSRRTARGGQQRSERLVHRRDLAVVRLRGVLAIEGRRRAVGCVRIVDVDPGKPASLALLDPLDGPFDDDRRRALGQQKLRAAPTSSKRPS